MCDNSACSIGGIMKKKILICDDEKGVRESLRLILSDKYELVIAEDGEQAIRAIDLNPDLKGMLLDIKMPSINGLELLRYIQRHNYNIPVVVVTGYQSVETATESIKAGAISYITKPFHSKTVVDTLEKAMS
jgi:DNA-binding NtrC family response regulator